MAYIGQQPFQEFASIPTKDSFTGDGSTTTFDLANDVVRGGENALEVFVNNVRQEPGSGKAFTLGVDGSNNYRRITFTAAPANGAAIYVINDKTNLSTIAPLNTDFNGAELVLDADADTTIHADTDDEIDIRIGGSDVIMLKQSSGDGIITIPVDAKDLQFTQFDGNKVLEINDAGFVGVGGNSNAAGEIRIFEDSDNGSNYSGFKAAASTTGSIAYTLPAADGSSGTHLTTNGSGVLSWTASVSLANDTNNRVITGTGSGLNGEANLTFDGSTLAVTGAITGSGDLTLQDDLILDSDAAVLSFGEDNEITLTHVADTGVLLNAASVIQFRDSAINIGSPADGDLDINADDEIELNSTLIDINGNVEISGTLTQTGVGTFAAIPVFSAGINVSGGTIAGTIATATQNSITTMTGLVTTGALDTGSITSGFGNIDNGASNITNGGLVKLDVDSDADDVTGDSATGRLTIGAGEDLNLYHGGTNSYVVNDTGLLVLQSAGGVVVNENSANVDFRVESNGQVNAFIVDGSADAIGMGVAAPAAPLHILRAGDNSSTTELLRLATSSSTDASGIDIDFRTADINGILKFVDGSGSYDAEFKFLLGNGSQLATPAEKLVLTPANTEFKTGAYNAEVALTDASTVAWNASTQPVAKVTLGGNRTLGAASNPKTGQFLSILFIQDGTGSRTMTFNAAYEHTGDVAPVLTTTANKGDLFVYRYNGAKFLEVGRNLNLTLS